MDFKHNLTAFNTILLHEISRFMRLWTQTILPSAITMTLYFVIFGQLIGSRIGNMHGFPYVQYIAPGLIMMSIVTNSYANITSSFFLAKFQRSIEEMLVSPIPNVLLLLGFVAGGVARGLIVGVVVTAISMFFAKFYIHHVFLTLAVVFLSALLFSLAGLINAIYAKKFDDIAIVPTFILTPLTYLGGVFYSVDLLSPFWHRLSLLNPILYMVNAFRYGLIGVSDINIPLAFLLIIGFIIISFWICLYLLQKGTGIRT